MLIVKEKNLGWGRGGAKQYRWICGSLWISVDLYGSLWIFEFEASLLYTMRSRTARATQSNSVSKKSWKVQNIINPTIAASEAASVLY